MKFRLALLALTLLAAPAFAQQAVQQSGTVTRGHVPYWVTSGVIGDGGSATNSPISSIGVTNNGGAGICISSDVQTAAGRNQLCFGASTTGSATISLQNYGTAAAQNLSFIINGAAQGFPTVSPLPVVIGDLACFTTVGGGLKDCGTPGGTAAFANPTTTTGLAVVNGSALTAMRSDASPPLSGTVQSALTGTNGAALFGTGAFGFNARAIAYTDLPVIGANTVLGSVAGGTPAALTQTQLTALVNAFTSGLSGAVPASGGGTSNFLRADGTFAAPGSSAFTVPPEGRLTLTSGTPVTTADVTGATTVYYTPGGSGGQFVPIWNGSVFTPTDIVSELSVVLGANWTTNTAYDWFVGLNATVPTLCSGPAWTNSGAGTSARGSGAGTTQLTLLKGLYVNTVSMTCNTSNSTSFTCAINLCTYVGSTLTVAAGQVEDSAVKRYTFNQYNPAPRAMLRQESTASWTYSTAAFRQVNAAAANQLSYFAGNTGSPLTAYALCIPLNSTSTLRIVYCGIGLNSTTVNGRSLSNFARIGDATVVTGNLYATYNGFTALGLNNLVWLEEGASIDTQTWFGVSAGLYQSGIQGSLNQ